MNTYGQFDSGMERKYPSIPLKPDQVVGYARKSTKEDSSTKSIADQHTVNLETAEEYGLPLQSESLLSERIGMSGDLFWEGYVGAGLLDETGVKRRTRPVLTQIVRGVQEGRIKCIVVWSLDRLWRDVTLCHALIDLLVAKGCLLYDRAGPVNITTPDGRQSVLQNAVAAQHQREKARVDSARGWRENRKKGKRNVNANVLGFRNVPGKRCDVAHVPEEQEFVRRIFRLYDSGENGSASLLPMKIAKLLMAEGTDVWRDPKRFSRIEGKENIVYINQINAILRDVRYQGRQSHCGIESPCPAFLVNGEPVVPPALFERVQKKLNDQRRGGRPTRNRWNLGGLMRCGLCGQSMYAGRTLLTIDGKGQEMRAWASQHSASWCWCKHKLPRIVIEWLDKYIDDVLAPLLLAELRESTSEGSEVALRDRAAVLRRELEDNKTAFAELASRIGKLDDEIINLRSKALREQKAGVEADLRKTEEQSATLAKQDAQLNDLKSMSGEQKRSAIQAALRWVAVIPIETHMCCRESAFKLVPGEDAGRVIFLTSWGTMHTATLYRARLDGQMKRVAHVRAATPEECIGTVNDLPEPENFLAGLMRSYEVRKHGCTLDEIMPGFITEKEKRPVATFDVAMPTIKSVTGINEIIK